MGGLPDLTVLGTPYLLFPKGLLFRTTFWYNTPKRNENESPELTDHS